eukprot:GFUD01042158.1.p1 GENE.GFUD01042158.1~~GFUD01042158.1.p1  ORF type:complete len:333 (-),score=67.93 GFUD01042158.1:3-1001(-)
MPSNMAYLLENQSAAHSSALLETLQTWSELESDVHLISSEGTVLQTHRVFLKLYSKVLNSALGNFSSEMVPSIFIPASTASLVNLLKILSTGVSISEQKEDLIDVINTAELLGITLKDIQIGTKNNSNLAEEKPDNKIKEEKKNKKSKKKKSTKKNAEENNIVKTEYVEVDSDISFSVSDIPEVSTFQEEFINRGTTASVKEEQQVSDSDVSLSLQLDSSSEADTDIETSYEGAKMLQSSGKSANCTECGKTFVNNDKLKRHRMIHTGEKPYPCDECDSKFSRKDKLSHHRNVKHNESYERTGHECYICNKAHVDRWHLNRHMERHHHVELI